MKLLILGLVAAASVAAALPAAAQPVAGPAAVHARQEARIEQGARTGALTHRETVRLQHREVKAHRLAVKLRAKHGRLTRHDRKVLARVEHRDSRAIHRLAHNGRRG